MLDLIEQLIVGIVFSVRDGLDPVLTVNGASAITIAIAAVITFVTVSLVVLRMERRQASVTLLMWGFTAAVVVAAVWLATDVQLRLLLPITVPLVVLSMARRLPVRAAQWTSGSCAVLWIAWLTAARTPDLFVIACSALVCLVVTIFPFPSRKPLVSVQREVEHGPV